MKLKYTTADQDRALTEAEVLLDEPVPTLVQTAVDLDKQLVTMAQELEGEKNLRLDAEEEVRRLSNEAESLSATVADLRSQLDAQLADR